ncbi:hypothetical protein AAKU55_003900 [Oxalobacteraceae bacterium GrIS 1.11]
MRANTLDDVIQPYLHLPKAVQTALLRVETHPTFRSLTKDTLKVLKALVSRSSARNGTTAIRARQDTVAIQAGVSVKTTQRAFRTFYKLGWVKAASSGRSEYGVFCSKRYTFSADFCELAHLPTKERPIQAFARETEMSDGAVYVDLSYKKDQQEISLQKRLQNPNPTPIQLPDALRKMGSETGIQDSGIAKLRGIAHQAGHKLEDVYTVAKKRLAAIGASAGRCYRYVLAVILNPKRTDFAGKAAQIERMDALQNAQTGAATGVQRHLFKSYQAGPGRTVTVLADRAEVRENGALIKIIPWRDIALVVNDIEDGVLTEIARVEPTPGNLFARDAVSNDAAARAARALRDSALGDQDDALRVQLATHAYPAGAAGNLDMIRSLLRPGSRPQPRDAGLAGAAPPLRKAAMTQAVALGLSAIRHLLTPEAGGLAGVGY